MRFIQLTVISIANNSYQIIMSNKNIKDNLCSFKNLYSSMRKCKRNVGWKDSVTGFAVVNGLANCHKLKRQIEQDAYKLDRYTIFKIYEPKERLIVSTRIKDRVFQRSLCDNYLTEQVSKRFIYDNCACLKHRGTDFARRRLKVLLQRHFRKYSRVGYVLKCDLSNYFGSTKHSVALQGIKKSVSDTWVLSEVERIIRSFTQGNEKDTGMGLGSQVTQLIQLAVLDELDHYIEEVLRIRNYIRYMDDFVLIHNDKEYLKMCRIQVIEKIEQLGLKLNVKKTQLYPITQPIHFLGFSFRLTETGKIIVKLLPKKITREKRRLRKLVQRSCAGHMTRKHVDECYKSWKSHVKKGNTHRLILRMDAYYKNLWRNQNEIFE